MNTKMEQTDEKLLETEKKIKELYNNLSPEQKQFLESYNNQVSQILQDMPKVDPYEDIDNDEPLDFSKKHPEILHPKHLTSAPHEIIIYVKAEVSDIDSNGRLNQIKDLCEQYYHIPVPAQMNYSLYMSKFFEKFNSDLELTCKENIPEKKDV